MDQNEKARILVVDDDVHNRRYFHQVLERNDYLVDDASSGEEAIAQIEKNQYDLILSDLHMYKVGGLDVLQVAKEKSRHTQVVIMTGYGSIHTAVKAMQNGAFDYLSKPVQKDALLMRVQKALRERQIHLKLDEQQNRIEVYNQMIQRDLDLAEKVQASLVPSSFSTDRFAIGIQYHPMIGIGGDFCNVQVHDEMHVTVNMIDVTGHGIAAALLVNRVNNEMREILKNNPKPNEILAAINDFFYHTFGNMGLFLTIFSLQLDLVNQLLTFSGGAHPAALLFSAKRKVLTPLMSQNVIIGFMPTSSQSFIQNSHHVESGDRILVYTDGILEAENAERKQFGFEGLKKSFLRHLNKSVDMAGKAIIDEIRQFCTRSLRDDMMMVLVELK
ncbi:MAG: response regulator [Calditrichaeota bacterium]|nr:MAG: response regulator [Calditrichota bacterium]